MSAQGEVDIYRGRYNFEAGFQGEFFGWGYQDFVAGALGTTVVLSANENGTDLYGFDATRIVGGSAVIVQAATPARKVYTAALRVFGNKVSATNNDVTTANITLTGVPHSSWGSCRIYYFYTYVLGCPQGYTIPSKAVAENLFAEIQALFITETELGDGSKDAVFNTIENTPIGASTASSGAFTDLSFTGSLTGTIDHTALSNIGTNTHTQIDTHLALTDEHLDWTDTTEDFLTIGTLGAGAITGTSFVIGGNTLTTSEWAFLDGQDQGVKASDNVGFGTITGTTFNSIGISAPSPLSILFSPSDGLSSSELKYTDGGIFGGWSLSNPVIDGIVLSMLANCTLDQDLRQTADITHNDGTFTGALGVTGAITGGSLVVDNLQISISDDDIYFYQSAEDKDIYFQVNDGGVVETMLFLNAGSNYVEVGSIAHPANLLVRGDVRIKAGEVFAGSSPTSNFYLPESPAGHGILASKGEMYFNIDSDDNSADLEWIRFTKNAADTSGTVLMHIGEDGKVGIGTATPGSPLHVAKEMSDHTPLVLLENLGTNSGEGDVLDVYTKRADGFTDGYIAQFRNMVGTKVYIRGDGNVGIGTTTPDYILDIDAGEIGDDNYDGLRIVDTGWQATSHPMLEFYNSHVDFNGPLARIYGEIGLLGENSKLYFAVADGSKNLQDRMVIDKGGNVGIGLTAVDANYKLIVRRATDINFGIGLIGNELAIAAFNDAVTANVPMRFYASEFNLLNGNVGINEDAPDSKLEINGDLHVKDKIAFTQDDKNEYVDSLADGYMDYGATTAHRFNTTVEVAAKIKLTAIGGHAVKLTNETGSNTVAGQLVQIDTATNDAFVLSSIDETENIGVVLDSGVADGSEAWIVVAGIADVAMKDNTAATRGNWVRASDEAGYADSTNAVPPGGGIPELDEHMREIGNCIESVAAGGGGTHILARCVLHFN